MQARKIRLISIITFILLLTTLIALISQFQATPKKIEWFHGHPTQTGSQMKNWWPKQIEKVLKGLTAV